MNLVPGPNAEHGGLLLLAPQDAFVPREFKGLEWNPQRHEHVLASLQKLRGRIYCEDGAITRSQLTADGRYIQDSDNSSWHIVAANDRGEVCGCARYTAHPGPIPFADSAASHAPLSRAVEWASHLRSAVESEMEMAAHLGVDYVEVGGWALTPEMRHTSEALRIALGMFSMARMLGGCIGLTTATLRHCSSSILRRIGGRPLQSKGVEIPTYFDPQYNCAMEILRFHSAQPNPRFEPWIEQLTDYLSGVRVIRGVAQSDRFAKRESAISAA